MGLYITRILILNFQGCAKSSCVLLPSRAAHGRALSGVRSQRKILSMGKNEEEPPSIIKGSRESLPHHAA